MQGVTERTELIHVYAAETQSSEQTEGVEAVRGEASCLADSVVLCLVQCCQWGAAWTEHRLCVHDYVLHRLD